MVVDPRDNIEQHYNLDHWLTRNTVKRAFGFSSADSDLFIFSKY